MDQVHIGYTSWNNPPQQVMPTVTRLPEKETSLLFVESEGYVSIEAEHFTSATAEGKTSWNIIPDFWKTLSGVTTTPVTTVPERMCLSYDILTNHEGKVTVTILLAPTLNFNDNKGLRYAICFDDEEEQVINFNGHYLGELDKWQANPIIESVSTHHLSGKGKHTLRIRPLDTGIVFEKILVDMGGLRPSYLGAPESKRESQP